jgi:hypothetical protein
MFTNQTGFPKLLNPPPNLETTPKFCLNFSLQDNVSRVVWLLTSCNLKKNVQILLSITRSVGALSQNRLR